MILPIFAELVIPNLSLRLKSRARSEKSRSVRNTIKRSFAWFSHMIDSYYKGFSSHRTLSRISLLLSRSTPNYQIFTSLLRLPKPLCAKMPSWLTSNWFRVALFTVARIMPLTLLWSSSNSKHKSPPFWEHLNWPFTRWKAYTKRQEHEQLLRAFLMLFLYSRRAPGTLRLVLLYSVLWWSYWKTNLLAINNSKFAFVCIPFIIIAFGDGKR